MVPRTRKGLGTFAECGPDLGWVTQTSETPHSCGGSRARNSSQTLWLVSSEPSFRAASNNSNSRTRETCGHHRIEGARDGVLFRTDHTCPAFTDASRRG